MLGGLFYNLPQRMSENARTTDEKFISVSNNIQMVKEDLSNIKQDMSYIKGSIGIPQQSVYTLLRNDNTCSTFSIH